MGNWGVHVLDDVRNLVFNDTVGLPIAVAGLGARVGWDDAGETPDLHVSLFKTPSLPIACVTKNVEPPQGVKPPRLGGVRAGYVVYCEGGRYEGHRAGGAAFDADGQLIREFKGDSGELAHCRNFLDAVQQRDPGLLKAPVEVGHLSSAWCHYGNAAYLSGSPTSPDRLTSIAGTTRPWAETIESARQWMQACGYPIDQAPFVASEWQAIDHETGRFSEGMTDAVQPVFRSTYREGYQIPEVESA